LAVLSVSNPTVVIYSVK